MSSRKINQAGLNIVKQAESCRLAAYICPAGKLTIGWGHTGPDVTPGQHITPSEADALLANDLATFEEAITRLVKMPITDNQFSALVSLCYNIGPKALERSTLLDLLNKGQSTLAADQFLVWTKAKVKGQVVTLPGLVKRRTAERRLFLTGV